MSKIEGDLPPAVEVEGLRKAFGGQVVLHAIDLHVQHGETLAILGKSGSGKSVLLKLIIGLLKPDAGTVRIQGDTITGMTLEQLNEVRKKVGFLFQAAALYDSLTIEENVAFPLWQHRPDMTSRERLERVRELLSQVGMGGDAHKMPAEISGGMKKRVGLARALALDSPILLCDEPTAGLDPITAGEIEELILKLKEQRSMASIVVTHDLHGARTIADRVALVRDGHIVATGTFHDLEATEDEFVSQFLRKGEAA